jgi:hypothetical protein
MAKTRNDQYSEREGRERAEKALRAAFSIPSKPQSEMKLGKRRTQQPKGGRRRKSVEKR